MGFNSAFKVLKYIHNIKATCFSYKEPSSGLYKCKKTFIWFLVYDWDPNCLHYIKNQIRICSYIEA